MGGWRIDSFYNHETAIYTHLPPRLPPRLIPHLSHIFTSFEHLCEISTRSIGVAAISQYYTEWICKGSRRSSYPGFVITWGHGIMVVNSSECWIMGKAFFFVLLLNIHPNLAANLHELWSHLEYYTIRWTSSSPTLNQSIKLFIYSTNQLTNYQIGLVRVLLSRLVVELSGALISRISTAVLTVISSFSS